MADLTYEERLKNLIVWIRIVEEIVAAYSFDSAHKLLTELRGKRDYWYTELGRRTFQEKQ